MTPSLPPTRHVDDLSHDKLLATAPRITIQGIPRPVPSLGGIPLLAKLGQGGMGAVYYGIHPRLDIEVAVKVLPFTLAERDPGVVKRFLREAKIAAKIRSPNLVAVLDVDEDAGLHFIVMEYVLGLTAGEYARRHMKGHGSGLSESDALGIIIAAARGLALAHEQSIVHRDIKPDNILIPQGPNDTLPKLSEAKLADLGLARSEASDGTLTMANAIMGTPGYMAPEQGMDTHTAGKPADIFSIGATFYALLTAKAPFTGTSAMQIILNTAQKPHPPITEFRSDLSVPTIEIIDRCLRKEPERRFAGASELLEDLMLAQKYIQVAGKMKAASPPTLDAAPPPASDDWVMPNETRSLQAQRILPVAKADPEGARARAKAIIAAESGEEEEVLELDSSHLIEERRAAPGIHKAVRDQESSPQVKAEPALQRRARRGEAFRKRWQGLKSNPAVKGNRKFIGFVLVVATGGIAAAFWHKETMDLLDSAYWFWIGILRWLGIE